MTLAFIERLAILLHGKNGGRQRSVPAQRLRSWVPPVRANLLALHRPAPHLLRMSDPVTRLNAALEGRYHIESELGEGGSLTKEG